MYSLPPPKNKDGHNAKLETSYLLNTVSVLTGTGPPLKYFMYTSFLTEAKTNFQDSPWVSLSHTNPLSYILSTLTHPTLLHRWQQYSMNANLRSSCPLFYRGRSKWHVESCFGSFSFLVVWGFFLVTPLFRRWDRAVWKTLCWCSSWSHRVSYRRIQWTLFLPMLISSWHLHLSPILSGSHGNSTIAPLSDTMWVMWGGT